MSAAKVFKKGETLIKEGEKPTMVYLIQSGSVSLFVHRQKQNIDLCTLGSSQIVGEHALSGAATHPHSAIALSETKVLELTLDAFKTQFESGTQVQKFVVKSLCDKLKVVMREFQSMKLERDNTPCPPDQTAKIFGAIYHTLKTKGELPPPAKSQPGGPPPPAPVGLKIGWGLMKQYAQRMFLESPKRLEMAVNIFVKLGLAKYDIGKPEDDQEAPEEIQAVHFTDPALVEQFFEFYQYHYFKGGKPEVLKTEDRAMQLAQGLVELGSKETPDRQGFVRLDYPKVLEFFKTNYGMQINNDTWGLLEVKGLFVKRQSSDAGIAVQFDFREFQMTSKIWKIMREIERWNEKGSVDPNEPVSDGKKVMKAGPACPSCQHPYEGAPKFCSECGHKFGVAAA